MKNLAILLILFFISCSQKKDEIQEFEKLAKKNIHSIQNDIPDSTIYNIANIVIKDFKISQMFSQKPFVNISETPLNIVNEKSLLRLVFKRKMLIGK